MIDRLGRLHVLPILKMISEVSSIIQTMDLDSVGMHDCTALQDNVQLLRTLSYQEVGRK